MMRTMLGLLIGLLVAQISAAQDKGVAPQVDDVKALLKKEPITEKSWPAWQERLSAWFDHASAATDPAYRAAEQFIHGLADEHARLPPAYFKDYLAWYVLGGSYLGEVPPQPDAPQLAEHAYRRSIAILPTFARGQRALAVALVLQVRLRDSGPTPNDPRLAEADKALQEAARLQPALSLDGIRGMAALRQGQFSQAAAFLESALQKDLDNLGLALELSEALMLDEHAKNRSSRLKPFLDRFMDNGVLAVRHAYMLLLDGRREEAYTELERARSLGADPAKVLSGEMVAQIENAQPGWTSHLLTIVLAVGIGAGVLVVGLRAYRLVRARACAAGLASNQPHRI